MNRRLFIKAAALSSASIYAAKGSLYSDNTLAGIQSVSVQTNSIVGPLPHFWDACVGSDRAVVGLRAQWLEDLETVHKAAGFKSVRFHGLFNDEMGVCPGNIKQADFSFLISCSLAARLED